LEAIRQVKKEVGKNDALYIHVTLLPYISAAGELKTKPTQHSVIELRAIGIQPDILVCRTEHPISRDMKKKIALFCDVDEDAVIENRTAETIYEVPLIMRGEGLDKIVLEKLNLPQSPPKLDVWERMVYKIKNPERRIKIAVVGKYVELPDAYISVVEALHHAGIDNSAAVKVKFINAEKIEQPDADLEEIFSGCKGILVPGGFGDRGIEGKIKAINFARVNKIPFLGLCLGMQCAVIEFARNVCNFGDANSTEFNPETHFPVIALMDSQLEVTDKGGTMRLGAYPCKVTPETFTADAYFGDEKNFPEIQERHRHRFEFNNNFREIFQANGMVIAGVSPDENLVEIVELDKNLHPYFVGCQFHPELKSRPNHPHPLFRAFVKAAIDNS
ncbi:MAG: CTP synthase, partial [Selenomonadaceae bacterium]|nr:CTP synthase [Selenomonadaceae bacterium]